MTEDRISEIIRQIVDEVDDEDYPETMDVIYGETFPESDYEVGLMCTPFELAMMLHDTDGARPMHPLIAQFCLEVYFDEYAKGNADAACNLGSLYYSGRGGEQSYAKAVEYYTFAADHGSRQAQENLGYCYYYGRDVEKDYKKAFHYFAKGAFDGHLISLYKIGDMYKNGYYVEKDEKEAFDIYFYCSEKIDENNMGLCGADIFMRVAQCYYKGIGVKPDYQIALRYYQMAEGLFYAKLENGDYMIAKNLDRVIQEEEEVRQLIRNSMPDRIIVD